MYAETKLHIEQTQCNETLTTIHLVHINKVVLFKSYDYQEALNWYNSMLEVM